MGQCASSVESKVGPAGVTALPGKNVVDSELVGRIGNAAAEAAKTLPEKFDQAKQEFVAEMEKDGEKDGLKVRGGWREICAGARAWRRLTCGRRGTRMRGAVCRLSDEERGQGQPGRAQSRLRRRAQGTRTQMRVHGWLARWLTSSARAGQGLIVDQVKESVAATLDERTEGMNERAKKLAQKAVDKAVEKAVNKAIDEAVKKYAARISMAARDAAAR